MARVHPTVPWLLAVLIVGGVGVCRPAASGEEARPATPVPVHRSLEPFDQWLGSAEWEVRSMAALDLLPHAEPGAVYLLARTLAEEQARTDDQQNAYAAACVLQSLTVRSRTALVREGGPSLVDALFELAESHHPTVRGRALEVLKLIPPVRLGDHLTHYKGWWVRGRAALEMEQEKLRKNQPALNEGSGDGTTVEVVYDRLYEHLRRVGRRGLELCVILDHTGSMAPVIGAAKARAAGLVQRLQEFIPNFRAALVTYDDGARLRIPLTSNSEQIDKAFRKVGAGGGGDYEEGVDKGVRMALKQELLGWSGTGIRMLVIVGDAPPHEGDVARLMSMIRRARDDELYEIPIVVHTVSTNSAGVDHFPQIAKAGGGQHVLLRDVSRLIEELMMLSFGGGKKDRERVERWVLEIEALRRLGSARPK